MAITIHAVKQGSDEWQELRRDRYTGTSADKLLKFGTIDYVRSNGESFGGNFYTKRGHILEDEALELYGRITGRAVSRPGFVTNSDYPDCGYSPDGFREGVEGAGDTLIEVKCFNQAKHLAIYNGAVPFKILAQIHFGLFICNLKEAHLVIYNPELDPKPAFKIIPIRASRGISANFRRILAKEKSNV